MKRAPRRRRPATVLAASILGLLGMVALACEGPRGTATTPTDTPSEPSGNESSPNVILVLVDTLRADHLSLLGYPRETSPNLERLAAESVLFEEARAQASCTYPSANSILTGRLPGEFLGQPEGGMGIPETIPSIAERLGEAGYTTIAVSASPIVRKTPNQFNPTGGFERGFDVFEERCLWTDADCVNYQALTHLDGRSGPFFLYLHYIDPHGPFAPPETWERRFAGDGEGLPEWARKGDPNPIADAIYQRKEKPAPPAGAVEHLVDLYDEEIAYFDDRFRDLLDRLEDQGRMENTLLLLVADHGEEFLEHGHMKHCHTLYDTEIRTPLLVRPPGGAEGRRIETTVSNLDVVPTILDAVGLEPPDGLAGRSLYPVVEGAESDLPGVAFAAWGAKRALVEGDRKLVYDLKTETWELFDLVSDSGETRNLIAEDPEAARDLQRRLVHWIRETEKAGSVDSAAEKDQEATERLRALGYIN